MNQPQFRETPGGIKTTNRLGVLALAGLVGGIVGFALSELARQDSFDSVEQARMSTGIWFALAIFGMGAAIIAGNAFLDRKPPVPENIVIAIVSLLIGGFVAGYLAQVVFAAMTEDGDSVRPARAIGWLIAGALGGLAVGASFRSLKRIQNGLLGGAAGGLVGGLAFDSIAQTFQSGDGAVARALGIILISTLMGVLIGLIDTARTSMWLEVVSGEMRGRQFLIMETKTIVGSARTAAVCLLSDRSISEHHLVINLVGAGANFNCTTQQPVLLNGVQASQGNLSNGDVLRIGNTEVRVGFKKAGPSNNVYQQPNQAAQGQSPQPRPTATQASQPDVWQQTPQTNYPPQQSSPPSAPAARPRLPTKPQN
jgi:hypothetical protein